MYRRTVLSLTALALLAACGTDSAAPSAGPTTAAQLSELGTAAYEGADESLGAMLDDVTGGFLSLSNPSPCPTITSSFTNDPVPTFLWTAQFGTTPETTTPWPPAADDPCLRSRDRGWRDHGPAGMEDALQVYLFGRLERTATGDLDTDLERTETLDDLGYVASRDGFADFHRAERSGTRQFSRTTTGIVAGEELVTTRRSKVGETSVSNVATATLDWTFTPDPGNVIQPGTLRPDGTISVEGSWSFAGQILARGDGSGPQVLDVDAGYTVTTVTPLVYDASCIARPRLRITGGQLLFTRTRGDQTVSFTLTWSACGQGPVREAA